MLEGFFPRATHSLNDSSPNEIDPLSEYRTKRSAERTPEPFGRRVRVLSQRFVVQQHAARALHYDFRLEMDGVLRSWAIPKGPSPDPRDKRLAVRVEDHPLDYVDFEGVIPEGNYGAGAVIVWDRGVWVPLNDPAEGLIKGKLLFELKGYKLRGKWTLLKTRRGEKDWLMIKEKDGYTSDQGSEAFAEDSILSGRAHALSGRHRRQIVLPERCPGVRAGLDQARARVERGRRARDQLLHRRGCGLPALYHQPGHHPATHLVKPLGLTRAAGLVHPRSGP